MAEARVLDPEPVQTLDDYERRGGGKGLQAARRLGAVGAIDEVAASGLRGRGGAGFPTGRKWRTVAENSVPPVPDTVVVNAAEGEPGTFKDRAILRANPYRVLEGGLIAALAVGGADRVVVALKQAFEREVERVRSAAAEMQAAGWTEGVVDFEVFEGPSHYLYGEETALLEVLDGREPFPRIAPPYRHGVDEIGDDIPGSAGVVLAAPGDATVAPPTLVDNVETLANVPGILAFGADWFRELGTDASPGTVVCTVSGHTRRAGVAELPMGTPLGEAVERIGGGVAPGRTLRAVLSGVAHPLIPASLLHTPLTYEDLDAAGSGLGAAGFTVFDDRCDPVAIAHGVSRFLAIESCGQCTPCKQDGLTIAGRLDRMRRGVGSEYDLAVVTEKASTVAESARCYLAHQHQRVIQSVLRLFPDEMRARADGSAGPTDVELIAPIVDIEDAHAVLDESHLRKQPDWAYGDRWTGEVPADQRDERMRG